jgi:hypothetical protein
MVRFRFAFDADQTTADHCGLLDQLGRLAGNGGV